LVAEVLGRFERKGLRLVGMKLVQADRALAEKHYEVHKERSFYPSLVQFLTSGPTVALVFEGLEAVKVCRNLIGATYGVEAARGTIRGDFSLSKQNNLVHGSDSVDNAREEIALWFRAEELTSYTPVDTAWVAGS